jgi:hypothetical protein
MPTHLKLIISALALIVAGIVFYVDTQAGTGGAARWVALFLGVFAVFSIWIFPEAAAKEIRKEAAKRRSDG